MSDERPKIRDAARARKPLDGPDAQALEGALQLVEEELAESRAALTTVTAERDRLESLFQQAHGCHWGWVAKGKELEAEVATVTQERDEARHQLAEVVAIKEHDAPVWARLEALAHDAEAISKRIDRALTPTESPPATGTR